MELGTKRVTVDLGSGRVGSPRLEGGAYPHLSNAGLATRPSLVGHIKLLVKYHDVNLILDVAGNPLSLYKFHMPSYVLSLCQSPCISEALLLSIRADRQTAIVDLLLARRIS